MASHGTGTKVLGRGPPVQDMPPPGGFPSIKIGRHLPTRGPSGAKMWGFAALLSATGFYMLGQHNLLRNDDKREKIAARLAVYPYLQAEEDRSYCLKEAEALKEEARVMKGRKGWKVGESVYNSGKWVPPASHI
mmetsp:Transcript_9784/g.19502  ORF Transcript_9784/g.19502 Transcript_9784/m.19502 type:complete len:134 (+) Transcript_9784:76-477(+)|eukprot:CAMPEP_0182452864 /NCGR_PEP_ID=MMETSP1319-20130603/176_1 /TAXON_ID=172717 /ORGANISM="Bolidomonas pacifica, Strain RCC208" /LENGTH=133 /DNA_ID=CAMNT_0024650743 /DNA_START=76 /DNA_END=477 /DNA_ORIENTATION=-